MLSYSKETQTVIRYSLFLLRYLFMYLLTNLLVCLLLLSIGELTEIRQISVNCADQLSPPALFLKYICL